MKIEALRRNEFRRKAVTGAPYRSPSSGPRCRSVNDHSQRMTDVHADARLEQFARKTSQNA
jgi:hypothetical protein